RTGGGRHKDECGHRGNRVVPGNACAVYIRGRPDRRVRNPGGFPLRPPSRGDAMTDTLDQASRLLHEAAETHHRVFRIVDGADDDWASWYADWLVNLSELPT